MLRYTSRRLVQLIPVLFITSIIMFAMLRLLPGDPASFMLGDKGTPEQVAAMHREMGLDGPLPVQYLRWLGRLGSGDFGTSLINGLPVLELMKVRFPATVTLSLAATAVALLIGFPVGLAAARWEGTWTARVLTWFTGLALATPVFWLGILLAMAFGIRLKWLPPSGYVPFAQAPLTAIRFMVLPAITLGLGVAAVLARFLQSAVRDVSRQDFVRTARAKGAPDRRVFLRHVLANAMVPVVTVLGLQFGTMIGGAVITEAIFGIPGIGQMLWIAISRRDYYVIQFLVLFIVLSVFLVNLLTDLCYAYLDPRIRYQ